MLRLVVADLPSPAAASRKASSSRCRGKDQRSVFGNAKIAPGDRDPEFFDARDLLDKRPRVDHDAVADYREFVLTHDARWQKRELVGLPSTTERVAGVMSALKTHHHVGTLGQPVHDLALALVAPLGADDHDIGHDEIPKS